MTPLEKDCSPNNELLGSVEVTPINSGLSPFSSQEYHVYFAFCNGVASNELVTTSINIWPSSSSGQLTCITSDAWSYCMLNSNSSKKTNSQSSKLVVVPWVHVAVISSCSRSELTKVSVLNSTGALLTLKLYSDGSEQPPPETDVIWISPSSPSHGGLYKSHVI